MMKISLVYLYLERRMYVIKRLLVTGYKAHELNIFQPKHPGIAIIKLTLQRRLKAFLEEGLEWVIISGQYGVELWAAEAALQLKTQYPHLKLAILPPFLDHYKHWNEQKLHEYETVAQKADYINATSKRPYEGPWQYRANNEFLLNHSDALLIIYDEEKEGSPKYIFQKAQRKNETENYPYFLINIYDLQTIADEIAYET